MSAGQAELWVDVTSYSVYQCTASSSPHVYKYWPWTFDILPIGPLRQCPSHIYGVSSFHHICRLQKFDRGVHGFHMLSFMLQLPRSSIAHLWKSSGQEAC